MKIKQCTCEHEHQDELYGKGMRAHNKCGEGYTTVRCTVCGATKPK